MRLVSNLVVVVLSLMSGEALACDQTPPPPQPCVQQLTCSFSAPKNGILPDIDPFDNEGSVVLGELPAFLYRSLYNPDDQDCEEVEELRLKFFADCTDLEGKPGPGLVTTFADELVLDGLELGLTEVPVEIRWQFYEGDGSSGVRKASGAVGSVDLPELEPGLCEVWAEASMQLQTGTYETQCGTQGFCFEEAVEDSVGEKHPRIEITNSSLALSTEGNGNQRVRPGYPILSRYRIKNWTDQTYDGTFEIVSENVNGLLLYSPDSDSDEAFSYGLSTGEGDDFPMEVVPSDDSDFDPCFPLPTPASSISPTASAAIKLGAGEERVVEVYTRTWGTCADGSCSAFVSTLMGEFANGSRSTACAGNNILVQIGGDGDETTCSDSGEASYVAPCGDNDGDGNDDCYQWLASTRFMPEEDPDGLILYGLDDGSHLAVVLEGTTLSNGSGDQEVDVHLISPNQGRILETFLLGDVPSVGEQVTLESSFQLGAGNAEGAGIITELTFGAKYYPDEEKFSSLVGLGRVVIAGVPNALFEIMDQQALWALDPVTGLPVSVTILESDLSVVDESFTVSLTFEVPEFAPTAYQITHDLRGYALTEFEVDCADDTDNDNDGYTDCDDEDCSSHPVCDEEGDSGDSGIVGGTDSGEEQGSEVDESRACGCSASGQGPGTGWLLLGLVGLARRRRGA